MTKNDSIAQPTGQVQVDELRTLEALEARTFSERFLRFNPEFTLFRKGISLSFELVHFLGDTAPRDTCERVQRDLLCDSIDSLWLAEHALLRGYENQSLVLLRRAYETASLMAYFANFPSAAADWEAGKRISNSKIRNALDSAPTPEPKEHLEEMYRVYSLFTHANRDTVYHRLLGEGNRLPLGCQGNVSEKHYAPAIRELLRQVMWFVDVSNFAFAKQGLRPPRSYIDRMLAYRDEVQALAKRLPPLFNEHVRPQSGANGLPET